MKHNQNVKPFWQNLVVESQQQPQNRCTFSLFLYPLKVSHQNTYIAYMNCSFSNDDDQFDDDQMVINFKFDSQIEKVRNMSICYVSVTVTGILHYRYFTVTGILSLLNLKVML